MKRNRKPGRGKRGSRAKGQAPSSLDRPCDRRFGDRTFDFRAERAKGQAPSSLDRPCGAERAKGQALVEFALALILLIPLLLGMFDLGHGVYISSVIANAAREGAHYGITDPTNTSAIRSQALSNTVGLDQSQINVTSSCSPDCTAGSNLRVTVTYHFQPVTVFFAVLNLTGESTMTIE